MQEVQQYIDEAVLKIVSELKRQGLFKNRQMNSFQKTEQLLYRRQDFIDAVESKELQIKELKEYGLKQKSKSITRYGVGSGEVKTEQEKLDDKIKSIEDSIDDTKRYINFIDTSLNRLKDDKFFQIIEMKYFKDMTHEEIGFKLEVDASTVSRNKNRLINKLAIYLFPDDKLNEMMQ